jgi:fatty-acyl-CoA synthase
MTAQALEYVEIPTLGDLLVRAAARTPDALALVMLQERLTYSSLVERAVSTARGLRALGVGRGDRVGILMPNCPEFVEILFATAFLGGVVVPINARFRTRELRHVVPHADLKVLCTTDLVADQADHPRRLVEAFPDLADAHDPANLVLRGAPVLKAVVSLGSGSLPGFVARENFELLMETVPAAEVERLRALVRMRDLAAILYTSGTTANPKGCLHTHEALVRNAIVTGRSRFLLSQGDRFWDPLPMFHVAALLPMIATFDAQAAYLTMTHFDAGAALDQIEAEQATWLFPAFPTVIEDLLNHRSFAARNLKSVRMTMGIGAPPVLRRLQAAIPQAVQISAYGSTETGGVIAYHLASDSAEDRATTCGTPFRGIEIAVAPLDRQEPFNGQTGEILVRGYSVIDGYYKDPHATAAAIDAKGWLCTGDLGSLDSNGRVSYAGRLKDMLKVGGENVAPIEVESVLAEHPAILMAQVVGAPDDRLEEVVAAFVEARPGSPPLSENDVISFCRGRLASFKAPRYVRFITEWPMSATKIQKNVLRQRIADELSRVVSQPVERARSAATAQLARDTHHAVGPDADGPE